MLDNENMMHAVPNMRRRVWPDDWKGEPDDGKGVRCLKCNCRHLEVTHTRPAPGGKVWRRRVCRNCGAVRSTYEG